jgi:hypothetical protein
MQQKTLVVKWTCAKNIVARKLQNKKSGSELPHAGFLIVFLLFIFFMMA